MKNQQINILIIDDNVDPLTLAVIRCLGMNDRFVIHVLNLNNLLLPAFRVSKYVKSYIRGKAFEDENVFLLIKKTCENINADIIIPVKEKTVRIVAERIDNCLEFTHVPPVPNPLTLELVRNKWLLYNWLYENKLIFEKPIRLSDFRKNGKVNQNLRYPILIKPFWGSGGRGITYIKDLNELINYQAGKFFKQEELLVQTFIPGFDIDVSALVENGEILAYNIPKDIAGKKKLAYSRSIEFLHNESLLNYAAKIFKKLEYTGIAHLDFRYDEDDKVYKLIDFNARFWSSLLGSMNAGINFPLLYCQKALKTGNIISEYRTKKYYVTNNLIKILMHGLSFKDTEVQYNLKDPLPLLINTFYWVIFYLKKLLFRR